MSVSIIYDRIYERAEDIYYPEYKEQRAIEWIKRIERKPGTRMASVKFFASTIVVHLTNAILFHEDIVELESLMYISSIDICSDGMRIYMFPLVK